MRPGLCTPYPDLRTSVLSRFLPTVSVAKLPGESALTDTTRLGFGHLCKRRFDQACLFTDGLGQHQFPIAVIARLPVGMPLAYRHRDPLHDDRSGRRWIGTGRAAARARATTSELPPRTGLVVEGQSPSTTWSAPADCCPLRRCPVHKATRAVAKQAPMALLPLEARDVRSRRALSSTRSLRTSPRRTLALMPHSTSCPGGRSKGRVTGQRLPCLADVTRPRSP